MVIGMAAGLEVRLLHREALGAEGRGTQRQSRQTDKFLRRAAQPVHGHAPGRLLAGGRVVFRVALAQQGPLPLFKIFCLQCHTTFV